MRRVYWPVALGVASYLAGAAGQVALTARPGIGDPPAELAMTLGLLALPVIIGCLVALRVPRSPAAAALTWVGAAPAVAFAVELVPPGPLRHVGAGVWVWNLAGFVALCLVFPNGLPPGRRWRVVAWGTLAAGVVVNADNAFLEQASLPSTIEVVLGVAGLAVCLAAVGVAVAGLVTHYRRGDDKARQQLRWLVLGAMTVPALLVVGWVAQAMGAPPGYAYLGLFAALLVAVPAAVAVAVIRHDLFDVDRLLGSSMAWAVTSLCSALVFATLVVVGARLGAGTSLGTAGAAFVTALLLLPMHRRINILVGQIVDRDKYIVMARIGRFVQAVHDGSAQPEQAEDEFRRVLGDPRLRLLLHMPGDPPDSYVDLSGEPAKLPAQGQVPLRSGDAQVGMLVLSNPSARRVRRARQVAYAARLPIEVSRLRLGLHTALRDVRASRARLVESAATERRSLERDLHDGAQQQIVSVGMRLRSVQRTLDPDGPQYAELEIAVSALEATIEELRRLAHGLRPSRLDDGLQAALGALVATAPVPVDIQVTDVDVTGELVTTTAYFVAAEAYTNALKHAGADGITIAVWMADHDHTLCVEVVDNGTGGASGDLVSVQDRVAPLGGTVTVDSPPGAGTRVRVEIPDAHRGR